MIRVGIKGSGKWGEEVGERSSIKCHPKVRLKKSTSENKPDARNPFRTRSDASLGADLVLVLLSMYGDHHQKLAIIVREENK